MTNFSNFFPGAETVRDKQKHFRNTVLRPVPSEDQDTAVDPIIIDSDYDVGITNDENDTWVKVGPYTLRDEDRRIVNARNGWLNDNIIDACQYLLKEKHPHICGLYSVNKQQDLSMDVQPFEFIQIINKDNIHWLTTSTIGLTSSGVIMMYDSMRNSSKQPQIKIRLEDVQQQRDNSSCSLFALAFATKQDGGIVNSIGG
jgi:hypothetical protein